MLGDLLRLALIVSMGAELLAAQADVDKLPQPQTLAFSEDAGVSIPEPLLFASTAIRFAWQGSVDKPGARSITLRALVAEKGSGKWTLQVVNPTNQERVELRSQDIESTPFEFWTVPMHSDHLKLTITGDPRRSRIQIDRCLVVRSPIQIESIVGDDDRVPIHLVRDKPEYQWRSSVARLNIIEDRQQVSCTASLLTDELLLTNRHCFSLQWKRMVAEFNAEEEPIGPVQSFEVKSVEALSRADDFAILRLKHKASGFAPGKVERFPRPVALNTRMTIIQHPGGGLKKIIEKEHCVSAGRAFDDYFEHTCDVDEGSSGSPLLNELGLIVGLHRSGFPPGAENGRNGATPMSRVFDVLETFAEGSPERKVLEEIRKR